MSYDETMNFYDLLMNMCFFVFRGFNLRCAYFTLVCDPGSGSRRSFLRTSFRNTWFFFISRLFCSTATANIFSSFSKKCCYDVLITN